MKTYEREEFLDLCRETIETFTQAMRKTAARVGLSCDFAAEYLQMLQIIVRLHNRFSLNFSRKVTSLRTCVQTSTILLKGPPSLMLKSNESAA